MNARVPSMWLCTSSQPISAQSQSGCTQPGAATSPGSMAAALSRHCFLLEAQSRCCFCLAVRELRGFSLPASALACFPLGFPLNPSLGQVLPEWPASLSPVNILLPIGMQRRLLMYTVGDIKARQEPGDIFLFPLHLVSIMMFLTWWQKKQGYGYNLNCYGYNLLKLLLEMKTYTQTYTHLCKLQCVRNSHCVL